MNSVHALNWGSTRMAVFFDACKQSCDIIAFVDTLIAGGIRKDQSAFLLSPKGSLSYTFVCRYSSYHC